MISVIIPLYNAELYIARCLDSVLKQSYDDIEIIIVDDHSSDGSISIVEQYQHQHPNIRLLRHNSNLGLMTTRCDGCATAKGDFLMFVDSDDALPQDAVKMLVDKQRQTDADIVLGDLLKLYVNGRTERRMGSLDKTADVEDVIEALIEEKIVHSLCGKLFRTKLFKNENLRKFDNLTIAEDGCLLYQLLAFTNKVASVGNITYFYYENKASSSFRVYGEREIENIIIAYKTIADVCQRYAKLHDKLQQRLTLVAYTLYMEQIPVHTVKGLLRKHGMERYGSARYAWKYLGWNDWWFFVKRFIYIRIKKGK